MAWRTMVCLFIHEGYIASSYWRLKNRTAMNIHMQVFLKTQVLFPMS